MPVDEIPERTVGLVILHQVAVIIAVAVDPSDVAFIIIKPGNNRTMVTGGSYPIGIRLPIVELGEVV
jgi:hypothetical protein